METEYDEFLRIVLSQPGYYNICNGKHLGIIDIRKQNMKYSNKYRICWFRNRYTSKEIKSIKKNLSKAIIRKLYNMILEHNQKNKN